jgi:hypothetical protein
LNKIAWFNGVKPLSDDTFLKKEYVGDTGGVEMAQGNLF